MRRRSVTSETGDWSTLIERFLEAWESEHPDLRPATMKHYREQLHTRLGAFASERGIASVQDFTREHLRELVDWLDAYMTPRGPISQRGKQMALNCAKMLLRWCHREGLMPQDISRSVTGYRLEQEARPQATRSADLDTLLAAFNLGTASGIRNTAMVHLMALSGLRVSEVCRLNAGDLNPRAGQVTVRSETSRGVRERKVDLPSVVRDGELMTRPEVSEALTAWLAIRARSFPGLDDDDPLFVALEPGRSSAEKEGGGEEDEGTAGRRMTVDGVRLMLRRAAARAGIDPRLVAPNRLRHHFGLSAMAAGVSQSAIMAAMGHTSPLMTTRYAVDSEEERRRQFARADIAGGVNFPDARRRRSPTRGDMEESLQEEVSLSEIARRLFRRG